MPPRRRRRHALLGALLAAGATALSAGHAGALAVPPPSVAPRPDVDVAAGHHVTAPTAARRARSSLQRALGDAARVETAGRALHVLQRTDGMLTGPAAGDPKDVALGYVRAHSEVFGLDGGDLAGLRLERTDTSPDGITHVAWRQTLDGIPVFGAELVAHLDTQKRIASFSGDPIGGLQLDATSPAIDAAGARDRAAQAAGGDPGGTSVPRRVAYPDGTQ